MRLHSLLILSLALALLSACAQQPARDLDSDRVRDQLLELANDPQLRGRATQEYAAAEQAYRQLNEQRGNAAARAHLLYVAERRLDIARAVASREAAEHALEELERERNRLLLEAARKEAELARREAERLRVISLTRAEEAARARADAEEADIDRAESTRLAQQARLEADQSRRVAEAQLREAELARREADLASAAADSLRRQIDSLSARQGSDGMVLTLGDVVFASGQSTLKPEALENLDPVMAFIAEYPERRIRIEGHTDSQGGRNLNQVLSQRRADAVRDALVARGIDSTRIDTVGLGPDLPVASNDTAAGRAQNRRVDIIALNP